MEEQNKAERVKRLIKKGFDIELISLELDIPIEDLKQYKTQIENQKSEDEPKTFSKMQKVRERYFALLSETNQPQSNATIKISEEELEKARKAIKNIENQIKGKNGISKEQAQAILISIFKELKTVLSCELPLIETDQISNLVNSEEIQNLIKMFEESKSVRDAMYRIKRNTNIRLAKAISFDAEKIEDIEELQRLSGKLTLEMQQQIPLEVDRIKSRIYCKILAIKQKNAISKIKNDIPATISEIITSLANGELDTGKANEIIDEEAKKRLQGKPKNRFALTEQQQRNQILIQIKTCIRENFERYPVRNPQNTILQLQQLNRGEQGNTLSVVIYNLIGQKRFKTARMVCQDFSTKHQDDTMGTYIRILQNAIRTAEINEFVLKGITTKGTVEEENAYFNQIRIRIKRGDIKPSTVTLGKTQDGVRPITLADVWKPDPENQIEVNR